MDFKITDEHCTGCFACKSVCKFNAINFIVSKEGFLEPKINTKLCTECGLCKAVCPANHPLEQRNKLDVQKVFACYRKDLDLHDSSSGGVFKGLAEDILARGGVVFGASFQSKLYLKHIGVTKIDELESLKGSKYVQSDTTDIIIQVKESLQKKLPTLFVGTPCQIAALNSVISKKLKENLYTCDLICHGVASPMIFSRHIKEKEGSRNSEIINVFFRNKKNGWRRFGYQYLYSNGFSEHIYHRRDIYSRGYLKNLFLRESCYNCKFTGKSRFGDITLGDYWSANRIHTDLPDKQGITALILNNKKGENLFNNIAKNYVTVESTIDGVIKGNKALIKGANWQPLRKIFFERINKNESFQTLIDSLAPDTKLRQRIYGRIKAIISSKTTKLFKK